MKYYLGVTDFGWYNYLSNLQPDDVNFWQPGGNANFRIIQRGEPFLFKLKKFNMIGGVGFFSQQIFLPLNYAWEVYQNKNGFDTYTQFQNKINFIRGDNQNSNRQIGCLILTDPIFFNSKDWIEPPVNWKSSIVQGKSYDTNENIGRVYWEKIQLILDKYMVQDSVDNESKFIDEVPESPIYGNPVLRKVRIGQSAFATSVISAYNRKCSISGEKTLPVLQAAHIKPYSEAGPNFVRNGLLLRSDIHKLFDDGYITISKEFKVEVSQKIREEFENGREYYKYQGSNLFVSDLRDIDKPNKEYIDWHNSNVYKG